MLSGLFFTVCLLTSFQGNINGFCSTWFRRATLASFYGSASKLASHFPDDFKDEVPRQAQALVAASVSH